MRLYDPHPPTLRALGGADVELMVGIPETDLPHLAQCHADAWVAGNITSYPHVQFRCIAVGNEINPSSSSQYAPFVFPAMQNIYRAIVAAGLGNKITVSTSIKTDVLGKSSPPADGEFRFNVTWYIEPILRFLMDTNAPLLVNVYPYFAYLNDMQNISRSFALLQLDAVYAAMEKILAPSSSSLVQLGL